MPLRHTRATYPSRSIPYMVVSMSAAADDSDRCISDRRQAKGCMGVDGLPPHVLKPSMLRSAPVTWVQFEVVGFHKPTAPRLWQAEEHVSVWGRLTRLFLAHFATLGDRGYCCCTVQNPFPVRSLPKTSTEFGPGRRVKNSSQKP